jgi:hypothetical protein
MNSGSDDISVKGLVWIPTPGSELWAKALNEGHPTDPLFHKLFRPLPCLPRWMVCHNPFDGIGGKLVGLLGFAPSRKNPNVCTLDAGSCFHVGQKWI